MRSNLCLDPPYVDRVCTSFLHLPLEIREQIYRDVLDNNPQLERELPGYPARERPKHVTAPIAIPGKSSTYKPLPSSRPLGYIPSALLQTCRQIYHEARRQPFTTNEFVFTEWMTSATSHCDAVLRSLKPWQRKAIRHVRFAMGLHELYDDPVNERGHRPAYSHRLDCVLAQLPGVRTVRLNLTSGIFPTPWFERDVETEEVKVKSRDDWRGGRRWIDEGLGKMPELRTVEVECSFLVWMTPAKVSVEEKRSVEEELAVGWCARVEEVLNEGREGEEWTRVVAVAKPRDEEAGSGVRCRPQAVEDALTLSFMPSGLGLGLMGAL
ncbi:hypothetical protein GE09DRAFT_755049 [Coniochaeta sp. 2T2.1]|nr:hypothetical protein GE09DRAFT_755049 [Coniochaeta sp. 2T2.1]